MPQLSYRTDDTAEEMRKFSTATHAVTTQGESERLIYDGMVFTSFYENAALTNGANQDFLLITPDTGTEIHLQGIEVAIDSGPDTVAIYEGCTVSANGTAVASFNRNRNRTDVSAEMLVYRDPTVTGTGTEISHHLLFAAGNKQAVNSIGDVNEWILKNNTQYLIRVNNGSGGNADVVVHIAWQEPTYSDAT